MSDTLPPIVRCMVYTRQSRKTDGDYSSSDVQLDMCRSFIRSRQALGWMFCGQYDDTGESGANLCRPGMQRLLADLDAGCLDQLVIHRLDRLSRRAGDFAALLERLKARQVPLHIVTLPELNGTAADGFLLNLLSSFAEFEGDMIRDRLRESRAALKGRGLRVAGVVPYGYAAHTKTRQLVPVREEARQVAEMFELAAKGETPRWIAYHANRRGWRTKFVTAQQDRGRWTPRQVLATLANPVYVGRIRVGAKTRPGVHEPVVSQDLFDRAARQIAARRTQKEPRSQGESLWPFCGKVFCAACGRIMSPTSSRYGPRRYGYYRCRSRAGGRPPCRSVSVSVGEVMSAVLKALAEAPTPDSPEFTERQALFEAWSALSSSAQYNVLPKVVGRIELDVPGGRMKMQKAPGAIEAIKALPFGGVRQSACSSHAAAMSSKKAASEPAIRGRSPDS